MNIAPSPSLCTDRHDPVGLGQRQREGDDGVRPDDPQRQAPRASDSAEKGLAVIDLQEAFGQRIAFRLDNRLVVGAELTG